jgi:ubiquinol-cytochrome c reductase iron-sulfur subunit
LATSKTTANPLIVHRDEPTRRDFLYIATGAMGAVGVAAAAWPLIHQMNPDASVQALASTEVDLTPVQEGQIITVKWRGKPVFIAHRTKKEIEEARATPMRELPDPVADDARVKKGKEQWLVLVGVCTHLGCAPLDRFTPGDVTTGVQDWPGGFFCPCHGSKFDLAGRVFKDVPAPTNLTVPPYQFLGDTKIQIGADQGNA